MTNASGGAVIALARQAERRLVETLRDAGATSADDAISIDARRLVGVQALRRLQAHDVIVADGEGRYWLDETALAGLRTKRRGKSGWILGLILLLAVIAGALLAVRARAETPPAPEPNAGQAAFRDLYRELIETNTTLSEGSCTLAAERMAARLTAAGYPAADLRILAPDERPKDGNLAAVLHGADPDAPALLLLAHIDVVEARREDWVRDPFILTEEGGYFYARGAADDKAQAAIWVDTMIRLRQAGFRPARDIKLALTCGEETADLFNGVEWLLADHRDVLEAGLGLNEGARGLLDAHGERQVHVVQAGEKVYQDFRLEVTNPGGHSSRPRPDNAIYTLTAGLDRLAAHVFPLEVNEATRAHFLALSAIRPEAAADLRAVAGVTPDAAAATRLSALDPVFNAMLHTTCVATQLDAGHAPNALAQRAGANVNCRILPGHTAVETMAELNSVLANPDIKVTPVGAVDPVSPPPPLSDAVMGPIRQVSERMWPGVPVAPGMTVGATDARYTNAAGIPTYGVTGLFADPDGGGAHGLNERIRVRSLYEGRDFLFELVSLYAMQAE